MTEVFVTDRNIYITTVHHHQALLLGYERVLRQHRSHLVDFSNGDLRGVVLLPVVPVELAKPELQLIVPG